MRTTTLLLLITLAGTTTGLLHAQEPDTLAALEGRFTDRDGGEPVVDATVRLRELGAGTVTDDDGRFRIGPVAPGRYTLVVSHIAYDTSSVTVRLRPGATTRLSAALAQRAIVLREILVTARSELERERRVRGTPVRVLDRQVIDSLSTSADHLGEVIRTLPGLTVRGGWYTKTLCIEAMGRMITPNSSPGAGCDGVLVVIDGSVVAGGGEMLQNLTPEDVESVEFLRPTEAGLRYGTLGGKGVLEVYTRGNGPYARQASLSAGTRDPVDLGITGVVSAVGASALASLGSCLAFECPFAGFSTETAAAELATTALVIPFAVHIRGGRRGPFWLELLASTAIGAAGVAGYQATDSPAALVGAAAMQVAVTVLLERR